MYGSVVLSFSAGYVNSVALLGFAHNAVSHVTGTVTVAAEALVTADIALFLKTTSIVLAFFAGAVISGVVIESEALRVGRRYGVALAIESLLLLAASLLFYRQSFWGELLAATACGLQNAMIATYSGSVIRTTHLTGLISDLGAAIGNRVAGRHMNRLQVRLQAAILFFFIGGAIGGSVIYSQWPALAMLPPALMILTSGILYSLFYRSHGLLDQ